MTPLEAHKIPTLRNRLIKVYDFLAYVRNRQAMIAKTWVASLRKRIRLRGRVRTILIVRLASLGDVVRTTAVVEELKRRHPNASLDYLTTEGMRPILQHNPRLRRVYSLAEMDQLAGYDWIINLQVPDPPEAFLQDAGVTYEEVLRRLSLDITSRFITGRHFRGSRPVCSHTSIFYCQTELEELFRVALLPYRHAAVAHTRIYFQQDRQAAQALGVSPGHKHAAIFLGSASIGGHDDGFRTYTLRYLERLVEAFQGKFTVVIFGTSAARTGDELEIYRRLLEKNPRIIDLVDKTSLEQLFQVLSAVDVVIANDSGPLHIALAQGTPVIGLFVNTAEFRISPVLKTDRYVLLNSFEPCFRYNYRWKFHCQACQDKHYRMYGCNLRSFAEKLDLLPVDKVLAAANELLGDAKNVDRDPQIVPRTTAI